MGGWLKKFLQSTSQILRETAYMNTRGLHYSRKNLTTRLQQRCKTQTDGSQTHLQRYPAASMQMNPSSLCAPRTVANVHNTHIPIIPCTAYNVTIVCLYLPLHQWVSQVRLWLNSQYQPSYATTWLWYTICPKLQRWNKENNIHKKQISGVGYVQGTYSSCSN